MKTLAFFIVAFLLFSLPFVATLNSQNIAPSEMKRKQVVEKMDKMHLRFETTAVIEKSKKMLEIPQSVKHLKDFSVAMTAPTVEFVIVPLDTRFLPEPIIGLMAHKFIWSSMIPGQRRSAHYPKLMPCWVGSRKILAMGKFMAGLTFTMGQTSIFAPIGAIIRNPLRKIFKRVMKVGGS